MKILAFDTTNSTLSVAVLFDKKIVAKKDIYESNQQAEMLVPSIEECLRQAGIWYKDLDLIAFTNGPGSFTGIRVGYSCAKALKLATNLPLIALGSLEVIAYKYYLMNGEEQYCKKILVVNDAKLEEFFVQEFSIEDNEIKASFEPTLIAAKDINNFLPEKKFILAGSAKLLIKDLEENAIIFSEEDFIDAKNIAILASQKYQQNPRDFAISSCKTLYIRDVKISQRKKAN